MAGERVDGGELQSFAERAIETNLPGSLPALREAYAQTRETATAFALLRAVGTLEFLYGDDVAAFRTFERAARTAVDVRSVLLSQLDRAWAFDRCGAVAAFRARLADAFALLRERRDDETAVFAAELAGPVDPDAAEDLLSAQPLRAAKVVPRADHARARIYDARGDRRLARHRAENAYYAFAASGRLWRAGECALLLYRITGKTLWLDRAAPAAAVYPGFIAAELRRRREGGRAPSETLTARQRAVLERLAAGDAIDDIARALSMSRNTVRIHIGRIYRVYGVGGRLELLRTIGRIASDE